MDPLAASSSSSSENSDAKSDVDEDSAAAPKQLEEKKKGALDFEAIRKHGYSGGPSVLYVPPPKPDTLQEGQDWSWSCGNGKGDNAEEKEAITERDGTRHNANDGAVQAAAQAVAEFNYAKKQKREKAAEARALSFSQKEKRKRDFGQASRGKNYVEEEKRILRDQGVYSGFDV
ncbi:hypothetical protein GOP47_0023428 [Adiantum capillus-veneris]|uniref:Uncharacterized protein n=1 Tax=Adiantum capillus-veneris TaxID=13818 RepID=A0A9D4Z3D3_ADICA|nr:hypothetical protein GOP47_0023428 [Adiantum capillus-veneris]